MLPPLSWVHLLHQSVLKSQNKCIVFYYCFRIGHSRLMKKRLKTARKNKENMTWWRMKSEAFGWDVLSVVIIGSWLSVGLIFSSFSSPSASGICSWRVAARSPGFQLTLAVHLWKSAVNPHHSHAALRNLPLCWNHLSFLSHFPLALIWAAVCGLTGFSGE